MTSPLNWKAFTCELVVYTALVLGYFAVVLHYLADWLKDLFDHDRRTYAIVALLLMVGQAVILEIVSSFLFELIRRERK